MQKIQDWIFRRIKFFNDCKLRISNYDPSNKSWKFSKSSKYWETGSFQETNDFLQNKDRFPKKATGDGKLFFQVIFKINDLISLPQPFNDQCSHHIETSHLISSINQMTGFYMMGTLVVKGLMSLLSLIIEKHGLTNTLDE